MNAIGAMLYREAKIRTTNLTFIFWDLFYPLCYMLVFGVGINSALGSPEALAGVDYNAFFLGGVLAMASFGIAANTSWSFFLDRDNGIFFEMLTYPLGRGSYLLGKVAFNICVSMLQAIITLALAAKLSSLPVARSSKRAPTQISRSQLSIATLAAREPCMPSIPMKPGWSVGIAPRPFSVPTAGMPLRSANARSSRSARAIPTPPPKYITGVLASAISALAAAIAALSIGDFGSGWTSNGGTAAVITPTSFGRSTSTGPGRPERAMWNASAMVRGMSAVFRMTKLCFTIGRVIPKILTSWKASVPIKGEATCPVIATIGTLSRKALAIPVTRFVAPGPEVAMHTPGLPVTLP